jgi:outer membrane lipoprotein-sorting protein
MSIWKTESVRLPAVAMLAAWVLALIGVGASSNASNEPTGEEVLQRFIEVTGGKDAYAKLKSRSSTGTISMPQQNITGPITMLQKAPNLLRVTGSVANVTFDRGFDGTTAFEVHSMFGARIVEGDERQLMQLQSLSKFADDPSETYSSVENVGVEQIGDRDAYKIDLTMKNGPKLTQWFDTETGLLTRMQMPMDSPMGKLEIIINMSDWRDAGGVKGPFKMTQLIQPMGIEQTIEFTKIESNVDIPDEKFAPPEEVKEMLKEMNVAQQPATQPTGGRK